MKERTLLDPITAWKQYTNRQEIQYLDDWLDFDKFVNFIKQPLALWMFIPCDKNGKPLDKPFAYESWVDYGQDTEDAKQCREYQEAEARVIFEGFEYKPSDSKKDARITNGELTVCYIEPRIIWLYKTIHELRNKVTLTEAKFKELGL